MPQLITLGVSENSVFQMETKPKAFSNHWPPVSTSTFPCKEVEGAYLQLLQNVKANDFIAMSISGKLRK